MGRPKKWTGNKKDLSVIEVKVSTKKKEAYKSIVKANNKTMQDDLSEHIDDRIKI